MIYHFQVNLPKQKKDCLSSPFYVTLLIMMSQNLKSILYFSCIILLTAVVSYLFFSLVPSEYTDLILLIGGGVFTIGYALYYSRAKRIIEDAEDAYSDIE